MQHTHRRRARYAAGTVIAVSLVATLVASDDLRVLNPPPANPPSGVQSNALASNFSLARIAQGSDVLENPSGVITKFGWLSDGTGGTDGTRTEPDENTYLVFDQNPGGPTSGFDYGRHFLYQGHENGSPRAYVTRINLDITDPAHRITLLTPVDPVTGNTGLGSIDGSTWDPFTKTLLYTQEAGANGGVFEIPARWTSTAAPARRSLDCVIGKGGFEGIHPDDEGNLFIAEDAGGVGVSINPLDMNATPKLAKQPNSFVYKFVPNNPYDLGQGGKLYALQASVGAPLAAIVFTPSSGAPTVAQAFADTYSTAQRDLRAAHSSWPVKWVLVHDTGASVDLSTCASFSANAAAKAALATPFKRPENLQFLPGSHFNTFFFDETGDTDANAGNVPALAERGSWGSIFRVEFPWGNANGEIRIVVIGDAAHAAFDNLVFADGETLLAAEDRGDTLHDQTVLDSVWAFDVVDHDRKPRRLLALGRDPIAAPAGAEDNEPTGLFVSDGAVSIVDLFGTHKPTSDGDKDSDDHRPWFPEHDRGRNGKAFRWFVTMQHGLNQVFEILERK